MKLIELTVQAKDFSQPKVYINPEYIVALNKEPNGRTFIQTCVVGVAYLVIESLEDVMKAIKGENLQ